ncbi:MAG: PQQ-binding-like beta-propeller repeat protein [Bryobacteraceae bacterium]|jgi:putative pyrroloquinoline-quinone-binding quinoprotein
MSSLPPVVVGPLSICNSSVRVQGQLIGAVVDLFLDGVNVGSGKASWPDQVFPLKTGATLKAGHNVTATQTTTGPASGTSAAVVVQTKPKVIGSVACETHIYECGQCLWLDGMVPGATVEVTVGGVSRGNGTAPDGIARIALSKPTGPTETLVAQQTACGSPGTLTTLPPPDLLPGPERQLPPPTVTGPLKACQVAVQVTAIDGARVTLSETPPPGFSEQGCFDMPTLWFQCPPLTQGAKVSASQNMPGCNEVASKDSNPPITVGPPTPVPPPEVVPPLCAGSVTVRLTNLLPGSPVEILHNGSSYGMGSAPASTFDFPVPPLTGGDVITARQQLCTDWSAASNKVKVGPQPSTLPQPVVDGPLYQCGAAVHVSNLHPGATVDVWSTLLGAPIGHQTVYSTAWDIPVSPLLLNGDEIYAIEDGCGRTAQSMNVMVNPMPQPSAPEVVSPVETCMRSVTVSGVVPGAHVEVYVNDVWRGSAIATSKNAEVPVLFGPLKVKDKVKARQIICGVTTDFGPAVDVIGSAGYYYLTQHFDTARTGWFPYETTLNVANVPKLKKKPLITQDLDGTVFAQPLYAHHVNIPGLGAHNVVYVATENDTVYAFDAETQQPALWQRSLIPFGEQAVPASETSANNIAPVVGITSTPVIDCASYTMWVVAKTMGIVGGVKTFFNRLYAIDISTGADRPGSPVSIEEASYPSPGGAAGILFDPQVQLNRPALLLLDGRVYIGFGSHNDGTPTWFGWVFVYDATTLEKVGVFCTTPGGSRGSVWQGGMGLAADPQSFIYFMTGNGSYDGKTNFGDSALKLPAVFAVPPPTVPTDFFTPANQPELNNFDWDFGSGGPMILPDPSPGSALPKAMVACGKDGQIYLLNRENMNTAPLKTVPLPGSPPNPSPPAPAGVGTAGDGPGVWGGPAFFDSGSQQFIYYCGNGALGTGGQLMAFVFSGSSLAQSFIGSKPNQSAMRFPSLNASTSPNTPGSHQSGGATPVVSSDLQKAGTGVVWALARSNPLQLVAFDATDLTTGPLFISPAGPWKNPNGGAFTEPTIIRGKVYVPSDGELNVFGL